MARRLYVGGLPYSTSEDSLRDAFAQVGPVANVSIIVDRMTGRSRGFGFVEMENEDDIQKAIEMWNGKELEGRKLTVNEARPLEARPPRRNFDRGRDSFGGGSNY